MSEPLILDHDNGRHLKLRVHAPGGHRPQRHRLRGLFHDDGTHDQGRLRDEHPHRHYYVDCN